MCRQISEFLTNSNRDRLAQPWKCVETVPPNVEFGSAPKSFDPVQFAMEFWQEQADMAVAVMNDVLDICEDHTLLNKVLKC